jgi:3-hydroxyisobutyrate dehydrogenase-like beta-hydroxyacid dehydrogenase
MTVLMKKDLRLAVDAAESRKIPLPNGRLALATYTSLCETGLSHKDFSVVYDHLSKMK